MEKYEFVLAIVAISMAGATVMTLISTIGKVMTRRRDPSALGTGAIAQLDARLERMEQAIDSMAVEVERVSEGQRFTARLLSERAPDRVGQ